MYKHMSTCYLALLFFLDGELLVCLPTENEPSMLDLGSNEGAVPVGGFIYRGCQSRRLYGSYVFGDKNGYVLPLYVRIINYEILLCISLEQSEKLNSYASKKQILNFHLHTALLWVFVVIVKLQMETAIFPVLLTANTHTHHIPQ